MKKTVAFRCVRCKHDNCVEARPGELTCTRCSSPAGNFDNPGAPFERCAICRCPRFYLSKDFNQTLGCLILGTGIVLAPVTYGLSLPALAALDWLLYKRVPTAVACYKCKSLFRGFDIPKHLKPFRHHTGLQFEASKKSPLW